MKTKKIILFVSILMLVSSGLLYSQEYKIKEIKVDTIVTPKTRTITIVTIWTVPKFILQLNASYLAGTLDLSAHNGGFSKNDFIEGKNFCARNGIGVNLSGKYPIDKKGNFWIDVMAQYNRFISNMIVDNTQEGKVDYNVFGGGLGADYNFTPTHKVKYYIGANALFSVINGNASYDDIDYMPNDTIRPVTINSGFRIGYSLFTGLEYAFVEDIGINFGIKYSHLNLILKKSTPVTNQSVTDLNDNAGMQQLYTGWKQFAYSSVYFGISYYFGVKTLRYKLPEQ